MSKPSKESYIRYNHSAKGRARAARYAVTEKRRASYKRYLSSPKGRATSARYRRTLAHHIVKHLYNTSAPVRLAKRLWAQAHRG